MQLTDPRVLQKGFQGAVVHPAEQFSRQTVQEILFCLSAALLLLLLEHLPTCRFGVRRSGGMGHRGCGSHGRRRGREVRQKDAGDLRVPPQKGLELWQVQRAVAIQVDLPSVWENRAGISVPACKQSGGYPALCMGLFYRAQVGAHDSFFDNVELGVAE